MATQVAPPPQDPTLLAGTPSCPANIRETRICWGYIPQAALQTPNIVTEMWSLTKTNTSLAVVAPITESDAADIGKGDEFPTTLFKTSVDTSVPIEKYASAEALAWAFCFLTGKATKTGTTPALTYAAVPGDPVVNCINLPPFSYCEQIRAEPNSVVDRELAGLVINDFALIMESGPGRANCRMTVNCVGTGQVVSPSGIVMPALTTEHFLNAASATINIGGIDYVATQSFISLEFRYNNNVRLPSGYYPGSGTQNGYAIRGRMEYSNRDISLTFVARAAKGSTEYNNLISLAENPLTVTLTGGIIGAGPATFGAQISAPRTVLSAVTNADADGLVTVNCTVTFLKPPTGDIITMSATCSQDKILNL